MKKADVEVGRTYRVKISGRLTRVQLTATSPFGGWEGRNVLTGRTVRIRTAAKLRFEIDPDSPVGAARKMPNKYGKIKCPRCHINWTDGEVCSTCLTKAV